MKLLKNEAGIQFVFGHQLRCNQLTTTLMLFISFCFDYSLRYSCCSFLSVSIFTLPDGTFTGRGGSWRICCSEWKKSERDSSWIETQENRALGLHCSCYVLPYACCKIMIRMLNISLPSCKERLGDVGLADETLQFYLMYLSFQAYGSSFCIPLKQSTKPMQPTIPEDFPQHLYNQVTLVQNHKSYEGGRDACLLFQILLLVVTVIFPYFSFLFHFFVFHSFYVWLLRK